MIQCTFRYGGDYIAVMVKGNELLFHEPSNNMITPITGIRISKAGVLKEHPDLKDDADWKLKAINRLKAHIKKMRTEKESIEYIKKELIKFGYEPKVQQEAGHRPKKL